jgi:hypothetical protein
MINQMRRGLKVLKTSRLNKQEWQYSSKEHTRNEGRRKPRREKRCRR